MLLVVTRHNTKLTQTPKREDDTLLIALGGIFEIADFKMRANVHVLCILFLFLYSGNVQSRMNEVIGT